MLKYDLFEDDKLLIQIIKTINLHYLNLNLFRMVNLKTKKFYITILS